MVLAVPCLPCMVGDWALGSAWAYMTVDSVLRKGSGLAHWTLGFPGHP